MKPKNGHEIKIICDSCDTLNLSDMLEFQGELKTRTDSDYDMITSSIRKYGIAFPFFVWKNKAKNYVLDGHGRAEALRRIASSGETVPPLPVVYVKAEDERQAKNLLLRLNSRYGTMTFNGLRDFVVDVEIDLEDVRIPELPNLEEVLDTMLGNSDAPVLGEPALSGQLERNAEFPLFCPECGEPYEISEDELMEAIGYEG